MYSSLRFWQQRPRPLLFMWSLPAGRRQGIQCPAQRLALLRPDQRALNHIPARSSSGGMYLYPRPDFAVLPYYINAIFAGISRRTVLAIQRRSEIYLSIYGEISRGTSERPTTDYCRADPIPAKYR